MFQQLSVNAVPHQCVQTYHDVENELEPGVMAKGAERVANNVNKNIFLIFDHFISYFQREAKKIRDERDRLSAAGAPGITDVVANRLDEIIAGIIDEFGARERRVYINAAFENRLKIKINFSVNKTTDFIKVLYQLGKTAVDAKQVIADVKSVYQSTMKAQLEICDKSLIGLISLIDVYRERMLNKPYQKFNPNVLNPIKTNAEDYSHDERVEYVRHIEHMKAALVRKFFNYEIEGRLYKNIKNFYAETREHIKHLREARTIEKAREIRESFKNMEKKFISVHALEVGNEVTETLLQRSDNQ